MNRTKAAKIFWGIPNPASRKGQPVTGLALLKIEQLNLDPANGRNPKS
jgi:hypothetical protein